MMLEIKSLIIRINMANATLKSENEIALAWYCFEVEYRLPSTSKYSGR